MTSERMATLSEMICAHLAAVVASSAWVGLVRATWLFVQGTLPDQFIVHGIAWNAGVAFGLGSVALLGLPLVRAVSRRTRLRRPTDLAALFGLLAVCVAFWLLSTSLEYWDASTWSAALMQEAPIWIPAVAFAVLLWSSLLAGRPVRVLVRRCAGIAGIALLATGGLQAYSIRVAPSVGSSMADVASAQRQPPVFLVLVDTLRADHLSIYGYPKPTSPLLDELAMDAVLYERTFAQSPWTRPSCASLLTARYPPEIGLRGIWDPLPSDVPILPQYMALEGYRTAGIVSSVQLSAQYGFDKGWDLLDLGTTYLQWTGVQGMLRRLRLSPRTEVYPRYNAEELTDRAIAWLEEQRGSDGPPFMYLHYSDPHAPYQPPTDQDRWREFAGSEGLQRNAPPRRTPAEGVEYTAAQMDAMLASYDAEIAYFDAHFGRFLDYLRERGIYDDAMIIVTADHGEEFGEHGGWAHGHTLYNELLRVPLIIKYPEDFAPGGTRVARMTALIDVVPTVREVLGASWPPENFRGRSLLSHRSPEEVPFIYADNEIPPLRGVIHGDRKLIQSLDDHGNVIEERFYVLDVDFHERGDGRLPSDTASLKELRDLTAEIYGRMISAKEISVDQGTHDELRALGYVE